MYRIFAFLVLFLAFTSISMHNASADNAPPLKGDMTRLKLISNPETLPNMMFHTPEDGKGVYLHDLKGRIVVLNLWATWCPPCVKELPSLNALQHSMDPSYLTVLPVSVDANSDEATMKFLQDNNLDQLKAYIDKNESLMTLPQLRGSQGIPVTMIIDPQSRLLATFQGDTDWNGSDARAVIDYYMNSVSFVPFSLGNFPR